MVQIGNFFFRYRNFLFIFLYLLLFIPSPDLFSENMLGEHYYVFPIVLGLLVTISGQVLRGATIGLAYIVRGGKDGKVYAEDLVTGGMFQHCRNPLYVGNILMLVGVGILANSLIYIAIVIPVFLVIYHAIVLAEEAFLRKKFLQVYDNYAARVNRWIPSFRNMSETFKGRKFNTTRWILKEYNTQYVWLSGIALILFLKYPQLTRDNHHERNILLITILSVLLICYLIVRYLKKSGRWKE
ncbi:MAG TPA: isoprenylcysteine carboxylmethyltransferase family protein [Flavitalea sp.]|nr:isoprenylcysteine carboxylmethyltransferase family protein [Flavitalea sp.]